MKKLVLFLFILHTSIAAFSQCWQDISLGGNHSMGLKTDGTLWTAGSNQFGQLGIIGANNQTTFNQVGTDSNWIAISGGGFHSVAINSFGKLWATGYNFWGQLGDGTSTQTTSFVQIGNDTDWWKIAAGGNHTMALKTNGSLWLCGNNTQGQMGNGTSSVNPVLYPISQLGTATDWKEISAGGGFCLALKNNGTLWSWGQNTSGQLGLGNNTNALVPTQVGTDTNWVYIDASDNHATAIKSDGSLWAWGINTNGTLGIGNTTSQNVPTQVGAGAVSNWAHSGGGSAHNGMIKTDGSLWTTGGNDYGQLGNGTTVMMTTPSQIGSSSWSKVCGGYWFTMALRTDGSIWSWGRNNNGQLGSGTPTNLNLNIPTLVPTPGCTPTHIGHASRLSAISMYPNPAQDQLFLSGIDENSTYNVTIHNNQGAVVLKVTQQGHTFHIKNLAPGWYTASIITKNQVFKHSFIKE